MKKKSSKAIEPKPTNLHTAEHPVCSAELVGRCQQTLWVFGTGIGRNVIDYQAPGVLGAASIVQSLLVSLVLDVLWHLIDSHRTHTR